MAPLQGCPVLNLVQEYREAKAAVTATDADCARISATLPPAPEGGRTDAESVEVYQRTGYAAAVDASAGACQRLIAVEDAALSTEATSAAGLRLQGEILHGLAEGFDYGEPVNKSLRLARAYALRLADIPENEGRSGSRLQDLLKSVNAAAQTRDRRDRWVERAAGAVAGALAAFVLTALACSASAGGWLA